MVMMMVMMGMIQMWRDRWLICWRGWHWCRRTAAVRTATSNSHWRSHDRQIVEYFRRYFEFFDSLSFYFVCSITSILRPFRLSCLNTRKNKPHNFLFSFQHNVIHFSITILLCAFNWPPNAGQIINLSAARFKWSIHWIQFTLQSFNRRGKHFAVLFCTSNVSDFFLLRISKLFLFYQQNTKRMVVAN